MAAASPFEGLMAEGRTLVGQGKWREAIEPYKQAIAADDGSHAARHNLALCYLNLKEYPTSLENVNRALQKGGSGVAKYHGTKATILLQLKRREEAVECVRAGLAIDPTYANLVEHAALKGSSGSSSSAPPPPAASHHAQGMAAVLGPTLLRRDGSSAPTVAALRSTRLTLLYYSASWCPPCRQLSPQLMAWAKANAQAQSFELVFASLDKSEAQQQQWFASLSAAQFALPYGRGEELYSTFRVPGVPALHVFCDGVLVNAKGVEGLTSARLPFPWVWGGEVIGRQVRIKGLEKAAHLNGRLGLAVGGVEASGRFTVNVEGEGAGIAIKRENLTVE